MGNRLLDQINKSYFWHLNQVLTWDRDGAGSGSSALSEGLCDPGGGETTQTQTI